jgi:hypothetical protein
MVQKKLSLRYFSLVIVVSCAVIVSLGCTGAEPDSVVRKKLDVIIAADFKTIVGDLPKESLRDSAFTTVVEYSSYKKGIYSVRAVVDFYYLRGVQVKRTVKYRYLKSARKWERYENEYQFYSDSASR